MSKSKIEKHTTRTVGKENNNFPVRGFARGRAAEAARTEHAHDLLGVVREEEGAARPVRHGPGGQKRSDHEKHGPGGTEKYRV